MLSAAERIFGDAGGFSKEREGLRADLRAARDAAGTLDQVRLANSYRRVGSIVAGSRTVGELQRWRALDANIHERRALQDTGIEAVTERFADALEVGGFQATLQQERAESMATPEVRALEGRLGLLEQDAYGAHRELARHVAEAGRGYQGERVLRIVSVTMHSTTWATPTPRRAAPWKGCREAEMDPSRTLSACPRCRRGRLSHCGSA